MTMNRLITRVVVAVASATIAGGAVVGAGSSAMAASQPVHPTRSEAVSVATGAGADSLQRYHQGAYRWDGHRLYRWIEDKWTDVTPLRHGAVDRWYVDQLLLAQG
jgi:hypothetical protein